jgi:signal transduction histidine kinase
MCRRYVRYRTDKRKNESKNVETRFIHRVHAPMTYDTAASDGVHEQLVAIFANELRHPLAPIRDAAAKIRQQAVDADTLRQAAAIIERQASDMHRLIGDLLDVSRMQVGALDLRVKPALLAELVEHALESAAPLARERGHTLHVIVPPDPVCLNIDVLRLSQALHNIIVNASKFTEREGHIHVLCRREDEGVVIEVRDTGMGIPAGEIETIFDLFWRCERQESCEPGLGLGLYLSRFLVEAHGGTVSAASDGAGRGSVFTVRLPGESSTPPRASSIESEPGGDLIPA